MDDTKLCRLANGDLNNDDDVSENQIELQRLGQHLKKMRIQYRLQDYRDELIRTNLN